tara:strand:+ start:1851 stop:2429 length:579 start_codon:yes stop_codon:yes gene_type:complete
MNNILLDSLKDYYKDEKNMDKLLKIIHQTNTKISLRIIDWFVTNYSKKHNVYYSIYKTPEGKKTFETQKNTLVKHFNTYHSYKSQLKSYSKKKFDPFCRRDRIDFWYFENNSKKKIETTIGQLNFFKWAIDNLIIDYIIKDYNIIEKDMTDSFQQIKKHKKISNERKKRQELSKSASRGLNQTNVSVILDFD